MKVAITGGTGFIGRSLVLRHVAAGDDVRLLSRRPRKEIGFPDVVKVYCGDLVSQDNSVLLSHFLGGADVVYHCAGELTRASWMRCVHVLGTRKLVKAASGNIGHWVQLSSVGAYGPHRRGMVTEETPLRPVGAYESSKAESDQLVQQAGEQGAFSCAVLRPSIVFGPDMRSQSLCQMIGMIDRGLFVFIGLEGASANYIFLDNVIEALCACGRLPAAKGKVYNLSDHRPIEDFVTAIADALGKPRPSLRLPEGPVRFAARIFGKLRGFPLTESRVDALTTRVVYPATLMKQELGYAHAVTMEEALSLLVSRWKTSR